MIDLTRFNGTTFTVNSDLIEVIEETPDTVVTLTTGKKSYKRKIYIERETLEEV